ncbi:histidine kinase [Flavobacterium sp. 7A]|uniref:PAS domain-containing sensor histidine kinase n=1 Tax=Flavobacterium sp. 7A TaxID=2940571 RepID=UPI002227078A|nr:histidine kinase [Flavobacterium sp. 7A]MCW2119328.1 PAS domain S-box-containing protein [Flavobacterium sp. 7A]
MEKKVSQERYNKTFKTFTKFYIIALSVIALISILSQGLIQAYLSNQANDSHIINYTAKLRTYSQSLAKLALLIEKGKDVENDQREFNNTLKQWQALQEGLLKGSEFLNIEKNDRVELETMYEIIEEPYQEILKSGNQLIFEIKNNKNPSQEKIGALVDRILVYEKSYLLTMDLIVFDYDRFSRQNLFKLKNIEFWLLGFLLVVLLLEIIFIFYPLSTRIRQVITGLTISENKAHNLANELKIANKSFEASNKELSETTFALERATYMVRTDDRGIILYANDRYCHVTRYNMSELVGKPLFYNSFGKEESVIYEHIRDPERKKEVWQGDVFDHASDGTGFWLDATLIPIIDKKGCVYQYLMVSNDITKRKFTEEELKRVNELQLRAKQIEQKIKSYSILAGQEKERTRVAAEIHDGIGQMLTSMRMRMEMLVTKHPNIQQDMDRVNSLLKSIIDETRRICSDLLPSVLGDFGLKSATSELLRNIEEEAQIVVIFDEEINPEFLTQEVEMGVYRILQESLNNIVKHSNTQSIDISLCNNSDKLVMSITDYGKGFNYIEKSLYEVDKTRKNNGLRIMKERAEIIGGKLKIESVKNEGTTVRLEVNLT